MSIKQREKIRKERKRIAENFAILKQERRDQQRFFFEVIWKVIGFNVQLEPVQVHVAVPLRQMIHDSVYMWAFQDLQKLLSYQLGRGFNESFSPRRRKQMTQFQLCGNGSSREQVEGNLWILTLLARYLNKSWCQSKAKNVETRNVIAYIFKNSRAVFVPSKVAKINGRNWATNPCLMLAIYCVFSYFYLFFSMLSWTSKDY